MKKTLRQIHRELASLNSEVELNRSQITAILLQELVEYLLSKQKRKVKP